MSRSGTKIGLVQSESLFSDPDRCLGRLLPLSGGSALELVPIRFGRASESRDWIGKVERDESGWRVRASDLGVDALTGKSKYRLQSVTDRLAGLIRQEGLAALHLYGISAPDIPAAVVAAACAQQDIPLIISLLDGEAELQIAAQQAELRMAMRATSLVTTPCSADGRRVRALLHPDAPCRVVPSHLELFTPPAAEGPSCPGPVIASWGLHGRATGLDILLGAFAEIAESGPASLLLVGAANLAEAFEFGPRLDRYPYASRVFRTGVVTRERALALLRGSRVAAFPLPTAEGQARVLEALQSGAPLLTSPVGALPELEIAHVPQRTPQAWAMALRVALQQPPRPAPAELLESFSLERARRNWTAIWQEVLGR